MNTLIRIVILTLASIAAVHAEPYTLGDSIKPYNLQFAPVKNYPDMLWAGVTGTLGDAPHYAVINGMTLQRQESAILVALGGEPITLEVVKDTWSDILKTCVANANDGCDVNFRTFNDAGFKISGEPGATYNFILLASPEHVIEEILESPVYPVDKREINSMKSVPESGSQSPSPGARNDSISQLIIIILLVVLILAVIAVVIVMNKKKSSYNVLFVVGLSGSFLLHSLTVAAADPIESSGVMQGFAEAEMNQLSDDAARGARERDAGERTGKNISDTADRVAKQLDALQKLKTLGSVWLSTCDVTGNPPGEPRIPSYCDGNKECTQCYSQARSDFNQTRATLEKLRLIYSCSQKFSKAAISFGDSSSGIHAVVGLAWQHEKAGIEKSVKNLQAAYDHKYTQLMEALHGQMVDMGTCEAKYGVEDWYDRFGFIYYEFMADKYKRAD